MRLHHVGYVVASIEQSIGPMAEQLRAAPDGRGAIHDPLQKVRVAFLVPEAGGPQVELVEPAAPDAPVNRFLAAGGGLHHLCYEVPDLEAELARMRGLGATLMRAPKPAAAFGGRRIAWMMTRQRLLLEYLEAGQ